MLGPLLEVKMSKKCTPLWREADVEVNMYKAHHARTTFGSWDVEKVHAVLAQSTFRSQNVRSTPCSDHSWKLRCLTSARRCGVKHIPKSKGTKHLSQLRSNFRSCAVEKVHAVVARSTFPSQTCYKLMVPTTVWRLDVVSRGRRSARDMFIRDVRRSGRWFPERGCHLAASDLQVC